MYIYIYNILKGAPFCLALKVLQPKHDWYLKYVNFLYLIQISPEVRNEFENAVFKIEITLSLPQRVNTSRQRHYGRYFADDDFKFIFKYDNCMCKSKTN